MKILITGATGYIGGAVAPSPARNGAPFTRPKRRTRP